MSDPNQPPDDEPELLTDYIDRQDGSTYPRILQIINEEFPDSTISISGDGSLEIGAIEIDSIQG